MDIQMFSVSWVAIFEVKVLLVLVGLGCMDLLDGTIMNGDINIKEGD